MIEIFKTFIGNLAEVFRHVLPSFIVLGLAWLAHPCWFCCVDLTKSTQLWIVVGIALLVGNTTYAVHRAVVHQFIDFLVCGRSPMNYANVVAGMIREFFSENKEIKTAIRLKNSQIILTAIFAEFCFVFSIWNETGSIASMYHSPMRCVGIILFIGATLSHWVSHYAERSLAER